MAESLVQKLRRRYNRAEREAKRQKRLHGLKAKNTILWRAKAARLVRELNAAEQALNPKHVSDGVVKIIQMFEGGQSRDGLFRTYWDANGRIWTKGFGHTGGDIHPGDEPWTFAQAAAKLRSDLDREYVPAVVRAFERYGLDWDQGELDGTASAVYNLGPGILDTSHDFGKALKAKSFRRAADSLLEYVYSGGQKLRGLVRRRKAERAVILG